ncbi:FHA domain-containing protein [Archangium violaceum]|uniref:FHA domain-containing protein n=1 Tax=Archangium violaceum TaxID=83451 RepID=UPI00193AE84C|nr:FHA domain-containing protein [Archangium violaceum]QRK04180.1 FHA domain-containing protein [Archangium violaceum]
MLKLIIEDDEGRKTVVPFVRDEITIGRQEGNTIRLTERNVSRRHARLVRQNGHVLVEDLGSYNGVRINGERIQGHAQLADGDLIQIGDYDLAVQREAAAQPPPQPPPQPQHQVGAPTIRLPAAALQAAMDELQAKAAQTEPDVPAARHEEEEEEDEAPTPTPSEQRRNSTAVIRMDQVEMNRPRRVSPVDAAEAPHLLVVSAELKGQEFACLRTEVRIGRTDDNDITIDHRSLSRTHAKIVREDSGEWRIIDMQSANGMAVNGESYAQAPLSHGDLIELGHVKLRFIGPGQSAEGLTHEGTSKGSKKGLVLALVGCVLLGVGGGVAWFLLGETPATPVVPPQPVAVEKKPRQAQPSNPAQARQEPASGAEKQPAGSSLPIEEKLQSARAAIDARDFDTAVATLESVQDAKGQRPTEAEELLKQARAEQESKHNIDQAQKEFDANRLPEAQKYLEASEGTLAFAEEHTALKEKVEAALETSAKSGTSKPPAGGTATGTARRPSTEQQVKQLYDDGVTLVRKQQLPEAESVLKKCIALEPNYAPCYLALGATVARRKRPDEGAQYYREFLRLAPDHEMAAGVKKLVADYEKSQKQPGGGK